MVGILAAAACDPPDTTPEDPGDEQEATASASSGGELGGMCEGELSDSLAAWQAARDGASNSYSFVMRDTLTYTDACSGEIYTACDTATTLTVADGVVVSRSFEATPASTDTLAEDCPEPYEESGDALGSHADGYPVATVDDVYLSCCDMAQMQDGYHTDYGEDYSPGDVVVTIGDDSLLQGCTARYCDDCGCTGDVGISIESITLGE